MDCLEVTDRLWEYLDGELAAKEAEAIGRHLAGCPYCRPHQRCDQTFLLLVVRSLASPAPAPAELRLAVQAGLAAARRGC